MAAPSKPASNPLPIQFTPFRKEDFASDAGVSFINQSFAQIFTTINSLLGAGGPTILPSGIDVQGSKVTGLAPPTGPTDAVSANHAESKYSAAAVSPQLDLGGTSTLKGLSNLYLLLSQSYSGTIPLAKLTGGGTNGSLTVAGGLITSVVLPT
jgi:hypothetical protein